MPQRDDKARREKLIFEGFELLVYTFLEGPEESFPLILSGIYNLAEIASYESVDKDSLKTKLWKVAREVTTKYGSDALGLLKSLHDLKNFFRNGFTHEVLAQGVSLRKDEVMSGFSMLIRLLELFFPQTIASLKNSENPIEINRYRLFYFMKNYSPGIFLTSHRRNEIEKLLSSVSNTRSLVNEDFPIEEYQLTQWLLSYRLQIRDWLYEIFTACSEPLRINQIHVRLVRNGHRGIKKVEIDSALKDMCCIGLIQKVGFETFSLIS